MNHLKEIQKHIKSVVNNVYLKILLHGIWLIWLDFILSAYMKVTVVLLKKEVVMNTLSYKMNLRNIGVLFQASLKTMNM